MSGTDNAFEFMDPEALCTVFELMFDIKPEQIQIMRYGEKFWVKPVIWYETNILAIVMGLTPFLTSFGNERARTGGKACRIHGVVININANEDVYDIVGGNDDVFGVIGGSPGYEYCLSD